MNNTILVIEDTKDLRDYLASVLSEHGYSVITAEDGTTALQMFDKISPDLVILDLGLPTISGESVCKEIKQIAPQTQVLVLTAKHTTADITNTLNLGADDYMSKPFEIDELLARMKARLRSSTHIEKTLSVQDLTLDTDRVEVTRDGQVIQLTPLEFKLLEYLMMNKGRVLTRDMILARVWASSPEIETRVVDVYMGYLRKKIDKNFKNVILHSVRGFGYMVKD
ncbi:MAG: response regulator transcription factor [bacterium]|nr:response regulator transcription factor [bacterium]